MPPEDVCGISRNFSRLSPCEGQVAYALLTRAPVVSGVLLHPATPRLACVKPVASVHPEPGSNSSLYNLFVLISLAQNSLFFISLQLTVLILILYVQENHHWSSQFLYYFLLICKSFKELLFVAFSTVLIRCESGCKDKTFYFKPPNVFGSFFLKSFGPFQCRCRILA